MRPLSRSWTARALLFAASAILVPSAPAPIQAGRLGVPAVPARSALMWIVALGPLEEGETLDRHLDRLEGHVALARRMEVPVTLMLSGDMAEALGASERWSRIREGLPAGWEGGTLIPARARAEDGRWRVVAGLPRTGSAGSWAAGAYRAARQHVQWVDRVLGRERNRVVESEIPLLSPLVRERFDLHLLGWRGEGGIVGSVPSPWPRRVAGDDDPRRDPPGLERHGSPGAARDPAGDSSLARLEDQLDRVTPGSSAPGETPGPLPVMAIRTGTGGADAHRTTSLTRFLIRLQTLRPGVWITTWGALVESGRIVIRPAPAAAADPARWALEERNDQIRSIARLRASRGREPTTPATLHDRLRSLDLWVETLRQTHPAAFEAPGLADLLRRLEDSLEPGQEERAGRFLDQLVEVLEPVARSRGGP